MSRFGPKYLNCRLRGCVVCCILFKDTSLSPTSVAGARDSACRISHCLLLMDHSFHENRRRYLCCATFIDKLSECEINTAVANNHDHIDKMPGFKDQIAFKKLFV